MSMVSKTKIAGFTLMELVVAIAIVGILAAIAIPSYNDQVVKTRRAAGASCLMEQAQFMERHFATRLQYTDAALPDTGCEAELSGHYVIALSQTPDATTYGLAATPQGAQAARDTRCGTLGINERGTKTVSGTAASAAECF